MEPIDILIWTAVIALVVIVAVGLTSWGIRTVRAALHDPDPTGSIEKKARAEK